MEKLGGGGSPLSAIPDLNHLSVLVPWVGEPKVGSPSETLKSNHHAIFSLMVNPTCYFASKALLQKNPK